jgi:hypothetical protein
VTTEYPDNRTSDATIHCLTVLDAVRYLERGEERVVVIEGAVN